jgi:amino acid transporter
MKSVTGGGHALHIGASGGGGAHRRDRRREGAERGSPTGSPGYRALPSALANVSRRFRTPVIATVAASVILLALGWAYLLTWELS